MGDGRLNGLAEFAITDSFLRRVQYQEQMRNGVVHWRAFRPRRGEEHLSVTLRCETLVSEEGIDAYQQYHTLESGDLPGICLLTFRDLTETLDPPRAPRRAPDSDDREYGHLHCAIKAPESTDHMKNMAFLATNNGVMREVVRNRD